MTLYRQLLIFTLALCFILFVGVWVDKLQSTRAFLVNQLESHAQDTATSLGLSLSPFVAENDLAAVETMMNAIFDRGYYRIISLSDVHNEVIAERSLKIKIENVPAWFISMIPLHTPGARSFIMDGWKKAGSVYVESHPGYAYRTLWQTAVLITIYFCLTGIIVLLLGGIGLQILLRPLRRTERQAEAIGRRDYTLQQRIPRTRELRRVVTSMNKMAEKVKEMFEEQSAIAARLRESAFGDPLTGLGNRRFVSAQIRNYREDSSTVAKGSFHLIQIHHLQEVNKAHGYPAGDELVKRAAEVIRQKTEPYAGHIAARLNGADFAVFLPDSDKEDAERLASDMSAALAARLSLEKLSVSEELCSIGVVFYTTAATFEHLLAEADAALSSARQAGPNRWHLELLSDETAAEASQGRIWWQKQLEKALSCKAISLLGQQAVSATSPKEVLHLEIFSRISIDGDSDVPAGVFIPIAERSAIVTDLDRQVVKTVLAEYGSWGHEKIAINLSATSLLETMFVDWVVYNLAKLPADGPQLFFEFPEFSAVQHLDAFRLFAARIEELGHGIGLDHFGRSFSNFSYLSSLRPHYVKIDAAFTRELETENSDSYFFIGALSSVAHSLDIKVIAEGVEKESQLKMLRELRVNGLQGYLIEKPSRLVASKL